MAKEAEKVVVIRRSRVVWTKPQDDSLIRLLLERTSNGDRTKTAFRKQAWAEMVQQFNAEMGLNYDIDNLKNRFKVWKKEYSMYRSLLKLKGFCWDDANKVPVAPAEDWEDAIKKNPDVAKLRYKPFPRFKDLRVICKLLPSPYDAPSSSLNLGNEGEEGNNTSDASDDGQAFKLNDLDLSGNAFILPIRSENPQEPQTPLAAPGTSFTGQNDEVVAAKDMSTSEIRNKRRCSSSAGAKPSGKTFKRQKTEAVAVMKTILDAFSQRTAVMEKKLVTSQFYTLQKCMEELNRMEGLDQALRMKCCLAFEKEFNRHMFLLIRPEERLEWLKIVCGEKLP